MKVRSRDEAIEKYGAIDFSSRHWLKQSEWLVMFEVPKGFFPGWQLLDTEMVTKHFLVNKDMHDPLMMALDDVHSKGLGHLLKTFDGCFNIRMVRGSNSHFSAHSYGLAIDINASENPLGATHNGFYDHPDFVECFTKQGFSWGGSWHNRRDPMHFSFCWE